MAQMAQMKGPISDEFPSAERFSRGEPEYSREDAKNQGVLNSELSHPPVNDPSRGSLPKISRFFAASRLRVRFLLRCN